MRRDQPIDFVFGKPDRQKALAQSAPAAQRLPTLGC
jgi:hypothetical protein